MELARFEEMKKTWDHISRYQDGHIPANFELEVYKKLLELSHIGDFYYYIFNVATTRMEYVNDNITNVLGIHPDDLSPEYLFENMPPEDRLRFAIHEKKVAEFFTGLAPEKVLKYKVSYDHRLRCRDGSYKWILMQTVTLQSDVLGSVIRVLGIQTDITHLKTDDRPSGLSFLGLDGEPSFHNVPVHEDKLVLVAAADLFTPREQEVLRLVLSGKSSPEIAELLHISKHTVDSHRKSILSKSGCNSLAELGSRSVQNGWV